MRKVHVYVNDVYWGLAEADKPIVFRVFAMSPMFMQRGETHITATPTHYKEIRVAIEEEVDDNAKFYYVARIQDKDIAIRDKYSLVWLR
jgi:hypothetical protein